MRAALTVFPPAIIDPQPAGRARDQSDPKRRAVSPHELTHAPDAALFRRDVPCPLRRRRTSEVFPVCQQKKPARFKPGGRDTVESH
jgi:hypothetical protein